MTNASKEVIRVFGPNLIRWALGRMRAGSITPSLFADHHGVAGCQLSKETIEKGLTDLLATPRQDLPNSLR